MNHTGPKFGTAGQHFPGAKSRGRAFFRPNFGNFANEGAVCVRYALNAVAAGRPALGIRAKNGVVLATEKKVFLMALVSTRANTT